MFFENAFDSFFAGVFFWLPLSFLDTLEHYKYGVLLDETKKWNVEI